MPVHLDRALPGNLLWRPDALGGEAAGGDYLEIGIVNNMPDTALRSTEHQFVALLAAASENLPVRVTFYALPGLPRSTTAKHHVDAFYSSINDLWDRRPDGLIVTGTEPRHAGLRDEPYWRSFAELIEWAEEQTLSAVWSCLAAHAAVLHIDGIERVRLSEKRFGLFQCARGAEHTLTAGAAPRLMMPHSRWNDLREKELRECGYEVLTRSAEAGVDAFVKHRRSLFVFFQGHPEYSTNTLLLEYRRDIGRYLRRERDTYPEMPRCYFGPETSSMLQAFQARALRDRGEELLAEFPTMQAEASLRNHWQFAAARTYRNWLTDLAARRQRARSKRAGRSEWPRRKVRAAQGLAAGAD